MIETDPQKIAAALAAPFPPDQIKWLPKKIWPNKENPTRALVMPYIDARNVMDRLDAVVGPTNWKDEYRPVQGGMICILSLRVSGEWLSKSDAGEMADPQEENALLGAVSQSLKRAAVHWGIARGLYAVKPTWVDYSKDKGILAFPPLPERKGPSPAPAPRPAPAPSRNGNGKPVAVAVAPEADGDEYSDPNIPF